MTDRRIQCRYPIADSTVEGDGEEPQWAETKLVLLQYDEWKATEEASGIPAEIYQVLREH